jgi:hypothetical protein
MNGMSYALVYILHRFVFRVVDFFHHWYIEGSRAIIHRFLSLLGDLDETFAVHLTLTHFFEPLYKDYSIPGRAFGIVFRALRAVIGLALYLVLTILFLALFVVWLALPVTILFFVFDGLRR